MNNNRIEVRSLNEYIDKVSLQDGTRFYSRTANYRPIYRGQADSKWAIEPSVYRNGNFRREGNYIRELIRRAPNQFDGLSRIEQIIKMQHYGLPTRLIDFTTNSLVALYFACCSNFDCDGVVYELHAFPIYNQDFVWISIITKYIFEYPKNLSFDVNSMINELKNDSKSYPPRGSEDFYNKYTILKVLTEPIGLYPRYTNKRIEAQQGLFVIAGMKVEETKHDGIVFTSTKYQTIQDLWSESREIIVPMNCKTRILNELEKIGISESTLFPELQYQAKDVVKSVNDSMG